MRREGHRVAAVGDRERLAELPRVLGVARGVVLDASRGVEQVRRGAHRVAPRVVRHAVLVDAVAEAVERLAQAHDAARVEAEELAHEGRDAPGSRRLVVVDDVAVFALFLEEVVDERLGLEGEQVVYRRGDEEHLSELSARRRPRHGLDARAHEAQLQLALEPPERDRVPPGKKSEW